MTGNANLALPVYTFSFILGLFFSLLGIQSAFFRKNQIIPRRLRLLLLTSFIINALWLIPLLIFKPNLPGVLAFIYVAVFPFAIYGFTRLSEKQLFIALGICTLALSGSVVWDYIELNTTLVENGVNLTIDRQLLLRPNTYETISTTGALMRPAGILGPRPHDASNLLAILAIYWIALIFRKGRTKVQTYVLSAVSITAMLMTQVASNILAFFLGLLFSIFAYRKNIFRRANILRIIISVFIGLATVNIYTIYSGMDSRTLWQWSMRVDSEGDWAGMTNTGIMNVRSDLLAALVGHSTSMGLSEVGKSSEASFVKLLMDLGLIPFIIFMLILSYPIRQYTAMQKQNKELALPYVAAVFVGFISLWHYGSVLTTTNEFVFLALYTRVLIISADERENQQFNAPKP